MPRPKKERCIEITPCIKGFMPVSGDEKKTKEQGVLNRDNCICLEADELQAIYFADYLGLYQEEAAKKMGISRVTFGRILKSARRKIARAVIDGVGISLE